ncbi:MAG: helix-turn-helix transcriptional regulator [Ferruginibacter sp.]|nr:helix-turn-helix transcriptional regulator [Ferruginibacter sp.]
MHTDVHIPVRSALSNYITAYWETTAPGITREVILPQGIVEMVFNLSDPMQGILPYKNAMILAPDYFLQGWNSHIVHVHYTGPQHLFGIRLQPYMVKPFLGILPSASKDTLIDLSLIKPGFRNLWHRLNEAPGFTERVAIIENEFPVLTESICTRTQYFCHLLSYTGEHPFQSIDELSRQICYSSRQLNRKAQGLFGVCAEELVIHKKFRRAVEMMHGNQQSLTDIAYQAGFYDQAHFCRTFKNFTGFTAKQYQAQKSELPFHIFS